MKEYHVGDMVWVARPTPFFGVSRLRVDKVRITETSSERTVEYETNACPSGCGNEFIPLDNDRIFDTKEEVFAKAETCGGGGVREIKFRGKSEETGAWVYGSLVGGHQPYILGEIIEADPEYIIPEFWEPVDPKTVGQFTGLKDKNGVEIYEDDVVEFRIPAREQQTHTGDNVPLGSYTEPLYPYIKRVVEVVKFKNGQFGIEDDSWEDGEFFPLYVQIAIANPPNISQMKEGFWGGWNMEGRGYMWAGEDGDLAFLLDQYDLKTEADLFDYLGARVISNVHDNPEMEVLE